MSRGLGPPQKPILEAIHQHAWNIGLGGCSTVKIMEYLYPGGPRTRRRWGTLEGYWTYPEHMTAKVRRALRSLETRGLVKGDGTGGFKSANSISWLPDPVPKEYRQRNEERLRAIFS